MQGPREGRQIEIRGVVQGVGFRPWVCRLARRQGIAGRVRNDPQGVTIEAFGSAEALGAFLRRLETSAPPAARIRDLKARPIPLEPDDGFVIVASAASGERRVSIPPDLATCPDCLNEVFDAANRRHRYAFTNCTSCGPRFSIARDVPYDRAATTMVGFTMCPACRGEYETPSDRRFHAQPNACAACGPRLTALSASGEPLAAGDPVVAAGEALRDGLIVAIKGIGGFHLACDASSPPAVRRLRERKRRDEKPLAVMVRGLDEAHRLAELTDPERRLLDSPERPIVLVPRRPESGLASEVAPGNPFVGLFLAYTPLHHLLLDEAARPLVMTSGNLSEEPMAYRDAEAVERLAGVADLFLTHDREIETRCDDSVARLIGGRPVVLRRSRGYVPRAIAVHRAFSRPLLACGAQLKNTFCLASADAAWLGPHIGDLENLETLEALAATIERMERFLSIRPEVVAHDLHPDYLSTSYASSRPEALKLPVQHHHAHVASAMAENGLDGPVLGVAYDGTGYGTDGTAWGGEILLARYADFQRLATLRPVRLAGGETAIREVWRVALALLDDAFAGAPPLDALGLFHAIPSDRIEVVRTMVARRLNAPLAHGVGRLFDAVGGLVLCRERASYEGQVALEWNLAADPAETGRYGFTIDEKVAPWELDLRPMVGELVEELRAGESAAALSGRFHNTLAAATAALLRVARRQVGRLPVVLTGGCFQNALLTERLLAELQPDFDVYLHGEVPPGDGGIALGQAVVADAVLRGEE